MSEIPGGNGQRRIRLLLVEDSVTELYMLKNLLAGAPDMEVVGTAPNGHEALILLPQLRPDLIITDYHMPVMDGMEFIIRAMAQHPCIILVLSVAVQSFDKDNIFRLLAAGALDVIAKPMGQNGGIGIPEAQALLEKIRAIAEAPTMSRRLAAPAPPTTASVPAIPSPRSKKIALVALGASTGGPQALNRILDLLPKSFPIPLVCVQHISAGFLDGMLGWLQTRCALRLTLARQGERPEPGQVYFAPEGRHLVLDASRRFGFVDCTTDHLHCPQVDRLLESVAQHCGPTALGVLLSGMGRDGAAGLKAMREAGAATIAQDAATSVVFGMPAAAIELDAAQYVLPTDEIAATLIRLAAR
ncbi:chemotaxis-specific protein-glutamate methyltransferase CheB [uncultured Thiodictyon sp.]|uniref:chemotaxis-specific protein-glutamate methyltransferase CheB n=1 Tax=uncultured Thiodictyon sp. TaxID=1846217 RepID=UPI0025ECBD18|nr:chemotaxis-specific protein-glutamate methyltransferase CheB [uncultured Thiodictyon sp.]